MSECVVVGIDTSSYTTSLAAVDCCGGIIADIRLRLEVQPGEIGLRQSHAVFAHIKHLPGAGKRLRDQLAGRSIAAVAASVRPRPDPESYLPVFRVGAAAAGMMAAVGVRPVIETSHQEGHLACIDEFRNGAGGLAVHLSGGTTDILVWPPGPGGLPGLLGGSVDLHAGQFVDRVGRELGLSFPAGPELDEMAYADPEITVPAAVCNGRISFSGPLSAAQRLVARGAPPGAVAGAVLSCIGRSVARAIEQVWEEGLPTVVLVAGGVATSNRVREVLEARLQKSLPHLRTCYPDPELCTDNAVGVARMALAAGCA